MTTERFVLKPGAICVLVGAAAVFAFRAAHGDLPAADPGAALGFIASHPLYAVVHLGAILGVLAWVGGLVVLAESLSRRDAGLLLIGRLGAASALVGAAVYVVDFSIDGFAGRMLAQGWATASPAERADLELAAGTVFALLGGTSLISIAVLWGLPLVLFGLAVGREGYPRWLGGTGMVVGAATFAAAAAQYLRPGLLPGFLIYGPLVFLVQLWSLALGVAMWRRANAASGAGGTSPAASEPIGSGPPPTPEVSPLP